MRICGAVVALSVIVCGIAVAQQSVPVVPPVPAPGSGQTTDQGTVAPPGQAAGQNSTTDPRDNRKRPLTPEEERQSQIRQFDPLDSGTTSASPANAAPDPDSSTPDARKRSDPASAPIPGSLASAERLNTSQNRGPTVADDSDNGAADFAGPAVLSRSYTVNRPLIAQDVKWSENFGLGATFSTGATSASLTPSGTLTSSGNLYGTVFTAGFSGRKVYRHDQFGIHAATQYQRYYPSSNGFSGSNTNIAVDYTHVLSRRLSLNLVGTGSLLSQNYTLQNPAIDPDISLANINLASSPNIQIFDTSTKQFNSQASITWQLSARLSVNFGGGYFAVIRDNPALLGTGGTQAQADVNYRWNKRTTLGVYYSFSYYKYQHGFGTSDVNTVGLLYSYAFSKTLQLRLRGGGSQIQSLGFTQVALNPVIAELLGEASVVIDASQKTTTSDVSAQLVKDLGAGRTTSFSFVKGVSPGNGVFQTSDQEAITADFGMKLLRVYQCHLSASHTTLSSVAQTIGNYTSENAQISLSRTFRGGFAANLQVGYRRIDIVSATPVHPQYLVTSGVTWSPPNGRLWPF